MAAAVGTARPSCGKAGKKRVFTPVRSSSGEYRLLILGTPAVPFVAYAQGWPSGNIKLVVVYPPGGSTDMMARLIQPLMQQRLGATIIVENLAGLGGSIGTAGVAKSTPDGSNWAMVFDNHAANPFVFFSVPANTEKDLEP